MNEAADKWLSLTLSGVALDSTVVEKPGERSVPVHHPVIEPGTVINGRYKVLSVQGKGGMGVVYRVTDAIHPDRQVALKTIFGATMQSAQVGLFKAEFRTLARLRHLNVVSVYDFESMQGSDDYLYTMEFVDGSDAYKSTTGNWRDVTDLLVQVCRALSFMHSRQIKHFDLKPPNVLLDSAGGIKVLDFGLAGARPVHTSNGEVLDTPMYMAPEILMGDLSTVDHRADLYSLGIMIYELLCRRTPFEADTPRQTLRNICTMSVEFKGEDRQRIPQWLQDIVLRLCAKVPADRFLTANNVIEAINREGDLSYEIETVKTREGYILSNRFVGRDKEFKHITDSIVRRTSYMEGEFPPALLVCGQSGVGKSRLMREIRHHVQVSRMIFVEGNCYEGTFSEYDPITELLEHVVKIAELAGGRALLDRYGPELARFGVVHADSESSAAADTSEDDPEAERLRMLEQLSEFFVGVSDLTPFVIYVNDLQWAQAGTTDFLTHMILRITQRERAGERVRLAVLGSYRDDEVTDRPLEELLDNLRSRDALDTITLGPLDVEQVGRLVGSMLGIEQLPEAFVKRVTEETAGNPFFVEEVMRALVENGTVYLQEGQWAASDDVGKMDIPASIAKVFQRRVAQLDAPQRVVLEVLTICGHLVSPRVLERVTQLEGDSLHEALAVLMQRRMVAQRSGKTIHYRIGHDRMREVLYKAFDKDRREMVHGFIAQAMERVYTEVLDEHVYEIAHHYWLARDRDRALEYSLKSGNKAAGEYANRLAIQMFERVLALVREGGDQEDIRLETLEKLGDHFYLTGQYSKSLKRYESAITSGGDYLFRARLRRKMGHVFFGKGDLEKTIDQLWKSQESLGESRPKGAVGHVVALASTLLNHFLHRFFPSLIRRAKDPLQKTRLLELSATYMVLCRAYFYHKPKGIILTVTRASNIAERVGDSRELSHAYSIIGLVCGMFGLTDISSRFGQRALDIAQRIKSPWHIAYANAIMGVVRFNRSEWEDALERSLRAKELFLQYGGMYELATAFLHIGYSYLYLGKPGPAYEASCEGLEIMERTGSMQLAKALMALAGMSLWRLGKKDEALNQIERAIEMSERTNDKMILCASRMTKGECMLSDGRLDEAIELLESARKLREENRIPHSYVVPVYSLLARAYVEKARSCSKTTPALARDCLKHAQAASRKSLKLCRRHSNHMTDALLSAGLYEWSAGRRPRARRLFERSARFAHSLGARLFLAEVSCEVGRCLLEGNEQDVESGRRYLENAQRLAESCNAPLCAERVRQAQMLNGGSGPSSRL